jgi:preprotein translocase subunit SecG
MIKIFIILQSVISLGLIVGILLQQRGGGLSPVFGGGGGAYRIRRGVEKVLFIATIVFAVLFFAVAFLILLVS